MFVLAYMLCLLVVKVDLSRVLVKHHILQHRAKLDGIPDLRLILPLQVNTLGIAASLNVKHTIETPAVLIIPNQRPGRVCRQGGLSSACINMVVQVIISPQVQAHQRYIMTAVADIFLCNMHACAIHELQLACLALQFGEDSKKHAGSMALMQMTWLSCDQ